MNETTTPNALQKVKERRATIDRIKAELSAWNWQDIFYILSDVVSGVSEWMLKDYHQIDGLENAANSLQSIVGKAPPGYPRKEGIGQCIAEAQRASTGEFLSVEKGYLSGRAVPSPEKVEQGAESE